MNRKITFLNYKREKAIHSVHDFPSLITSRSLSPSDLLFRETPLHVAVSLGFPHLSHFLQESEGQRMVSMANDEGQSPLTLAQKHGDPVLISALTE